MLDPNRDMPARVCRHMQRTGLLAAIEYVSVVNDLCATAWLGQTIAHSLLTSSDQANPNMESDKYVALAGTKPTGTCVDSAGEDEVLLEEKSSSPKLLAVLADLQAVWLAGLAASRRPGRCCMPRFLRLWFPNGITMPTIRMAFWCRCFRPI